MVNYKEIASILDKEVIEEKDDSNVSIKMNNTNVVSGKKLRKVQSDTLKETAEYLARTFGPMGSNTKIISGSNMGDINTSYSKDGLKVLKSIMNSRPIEMSIIEELVEMTRSVEKEVGDGTTSTVILSHLVFDNLIKLQDKYKMTPYQLIRMFDSIVTEIKEQIKKAGREFSNEDAYHISMISTNGNEFVSENIQNIYDEYGKDVDITVGISNNKDSQIKIYDGLMITEGFSDPAYINNAVDNTCELRNPHIYYFRDPINTTDMIAYFENILQYNIYDPIQNNECDHEMIPTVICCPQLSRDLSANLKKLIQILYSYDAKGSSSAKPPILIISDIVASDELIMNDISNLCGCKAIAKYIDPEMHKRDAEAGLAPTFENAYEFYGTAELVVSDSKKTKFINPPHAKEGDPVYDAMVNFLETEIEQHKAENNANDNGLLKKRLSALKANMVEYLVGGVTITDRDMVKDLIEDAVKNCKSASADGVGYAANYEGLMASYAVYNKYKNNGNEKLADIALTIYTAYYKITEILYSTVSVDPDEIEKAIATSMHAYSGPYNISEGSIPLGCDDESNVYCTIMLDISILNTLSKIITMMVTCNQCLLQAPNLNSY